jgi:nucleobase:cation symporter-1, NCS1 family
MGHVKADATGLMTGAPLGTETGIELVEEAAGIERRSIDFVPESERHGRLSGQGVFWFLTNFQFFSIAIGFIGPSLGLSLGYTLLAATLGIVIGSLAQAFHASQGPEMGLPQMIQSRAQFGYRGVAVPLIIVMVSLMGYNVVSTVLVSDGSHALWGVNRVGMAMSLSLLAAILAIWGYDWLHRIFKVLFWINLPIFSTLSIAAFMERAGGGTHLTGHWSWAAFGTQLASAASYCVTSAPTVSDYSRYLPSNTSRSQIILQVFLGSTLSAIWLIALGAWLATHMGYSDALLAVQHEGDHLYSGLGSVMAAITIGALVAGMGATVYSTMLAFLTTVDCLRPVRPTCSLRVMVILGVMVVWIAISIFMTGNAITFVNSMLVIMLYLLMPWTAVNLVDYFFLRRGRYSIVDLFRVDGIYGAWGARGLIAYAVGFVVSIPFFVIPGVYTGILAARLEGVDFGWLISGFAAAATYVLLSRRFNSKAEDQAIMASSRALVSSVTPGY